MKVYLSPDYLEISDILQQIEEFDNKIISKMWKKNFREKFNEIYLRKYSDADPTNDDEYIKVVLLNFKIEKEDYLFWLSLKLSIISPCLVQSVLNNASNSFSKYKFKQEVKENVLPRLERDWKWTSVRNKSEASYWEKYTRDPFSSIFNHHFIDAIVWELTENFHSGSWDDLVDLIMYNKSPSKKILMSYESTYELCSIFSILIKKNAVNISYSQLAIWIKENFVILNSNREQTLASTISIEKYLGKDYPIPDHLKTWF